MLEEVRDKVKITDIGHIGEAKVEGQVDKPTFIRGGTMLKGATQERATQFGTMIAPHKTEQILVQCIHASRGIRAGAGFLPSGHTPRKVYSMMLAKRSQSHTWEAVSNYSRSALAETPRAGGFEASDDLLGTMEVVERFRENLKEILKNIPSYINQVGTAIIDPDGILGFEMYDHPDSWKAFSESIIRSFSDALTKESKADVFIPNMEAIIPAIHSLLREIQKAKEEEVFNKNNARTIILKAEGFVGEYTEFNGKTIHLLITRYEKEPREPQPRRLPLMSRTATIPSLRLAEPAPSRETYSEEIPRALYTTSSHEPTLQRLSRRWKTRFELLNILDQPKTWTLLKDEVSMSKATVASALKDLQQIGAVDRHKDENGITRYSRTGIGYQLLKQKDQE